MDNPRQHQEHVVTFEDLGKRIAEALLAERAAIRELDARRDAVAKLRQEFGQVPRNLFYAASRAVVDAVQKYGDAQLPSWIGKFGG
jgi:hypothetical protein